MTTGSQHKGIYLDNSVNLFNFETDFFGVTFERYNIFVKDSYEFGKRLADAIYNNGKKMITDRQVESVRQYVGYSSDSTNNIGKQMGIITCYWLYL